MKKYIGFFDSGLGGITVLREVLKKDSQIDFVYFGDNKNAPYGQKSQKEIIELTKKAFAFLKEKKCSRIVTACNSVSTIVTKELAQEAGFERRDIIEMSESTVKSCTQKKLKNILILSTEATKKSGLYTKQFQKENIKTESLSINGLVDLIEENLLEYEKEKAIKRELKKDKIILQKMKNGEFQNVILACTHFPLVEDIFEKVFLSLVEKSFSKNSKKEEINFINPAVFVAEEVFEKFFVNEKRVEKNALEKDIESSQESILEKKVELAPPIPPPKEPQNSQEFPAILFSKNKKFYFSKNSQKTKTFLKDFLK